MGIKFVGIKDIPRSIPGGVVFCSSSSFTAAMNDLADVFKPHKYDWPVSKEEIEDALDEALLSRSGEERFFAVYGLCEEVDDA